MFNTEKFHAALTGFVKTSALASILACALLAEAAASTQSAPVADNLREKSAESTGRCGVKSLARRTSYILGDSIGFGLQLDGLEAKLQATLGGTSRISYDGGRSITAPGHQINKSALESVDMDRAFIADSSVIVIVLGTNQLESSFVESQQQLMQKLRTIAPRAAYYWVDIGATMSNQVEGWNARNKTIYGNADALGYTVISRYKAIFGPAADPLHIKPGQNFPDLQTEPGYGGVGNIHGAYPRLSNAIVDVVSDAYGCATGG